jgi:hypothetical protein
VAGLAPKLQLGGPIPGWIFICANKTNQELDKIIKQKNIINFITTQRL